MKVKRTVIICVACASVIGTAVLVGAVIMSRKPVAFSIIATPDVSIKLKDEFIRYKSKGAGVILAEGFIRAVDDKIYTMYGSEVEDTLPFPEITGVRAVPFDRSELNKYLNFYLYTAGLTGMKIVVTAEAFSCDQFLAIANEIEQKFDSGALFGIGLKTKFPPEELNCILENINCRLIIFADGEYLNSITDAGLRLRKTDVICLENAEYAKKTVRNIRKKCIVWMMAEDDGQSDRLVYRKYS